MPAIGSKSGRGTAARGFTLIEVLVALFVLALGLLGMALLQTAGLRFNTNSYARTQATYFAYDIIDRMRANTEAFTDGAYDIDGTTDAEGAISTYGGCKNGGTCDCAANACTNAQLAQYDLGQWYELQDRLLPGAKAAADAGQRATIVRNGNTATVTLLWQEQDHENAEVKSQVWYAELRP